MSDDGNNEGTGVTVRPRGDLPDGSAFGNYRIRRRLGSGGMGAVYEAEQVGDGRVVALKVLNVDLDKLAARDRFLREGRSAAAVNHPNTVCVYRTEEIDGVPAICMELVADGTLEERVRTRGPLPFDEVVEFALQMIDGLAAAHDVGVLHRDVKPANCFVGADGTLKVGDFGLSKPVNAEEQLRLTQTGMFLGTPVFSSPEQLLGERIDVRSDIYAVGVTLYYALTGQLPYASGSMAQVIATVINGKPTPISTYRADVPEAITTVVLKAMARVVAERYQNYDEFRNAVIGLRASTLESATASSRLRAWLIDTIFVVLVSLGPTALLQHSRGLTLFAKNEGVDPFSTFLELLAALLVVAIPEGMTGKSLGKWLIGIQVVNSDGQPPGIAKAALRTILLFSCWFVSDIWKALIGESGETPVTMLARLAMLSTARYSNGWRTVYDVVTQTKVVRVQRAVANSRRRATALAAPLPGQFGEPIGTYTTLRDVIPIPGAVAAWDAMLERQVWLAPGNTGSEITIARRNVMRNTRLRWLESVEANGMRWNSYSAPGGLTLKERLTRPVSWEELQG